ncbi:FMN reductase [Streptomyces sp. H10-C2]|uniref:FMN reductase n=1 Tax=unclassified Streptomyces TaxID=2593676 RepID=UPI0024B8AF10|nr:MULTISPECIES: FMN reductase [unclassified Streptomyces]MDJ0343361.1 FMN reductase [Streptomyces sp. PH10-H1]MDJ0371828.1 FMN reductase [Streptomyces sp. H10-C2]
MNTLNLVIVSAGLSQPSSTRLLADRLGEATRRGLRDQDPDRAVEVRIVELRDLATDIAHHLVTGFPSAALRDAIEATERADGLIAVTPIFSASYSGLFKSFFDVIDDGALAGKPVLIAATGGTARHSLALEHALRPLFAYLHSLVMPTAVYAASEDWGSGGDASTDGLAARIARAAGELAGHMSDRSTTSPPAADQVIPFAQQLAALRPA